MNINISQAQNSGWTETSTIYLTMPMPSPSELLSVESPSGGGESSYGCPVCNVQFQNRGQLMGHTRKHLKDKLFQCKLCEQNFPTHNELKSHMGDKTETDEFSINCGICGRSFPSQQCLTYHLNCHKQAGSAPVIIDNPAADRSEYQIQIQVEDSMVDVDVKFDPLLQGETLTVDPSQIEISQIGNVVLLPSSPNSSVITTQANNIHVEVLSNPNNHRYSCSLCNKTFKNSQHVQRHLRIHTGEKPFSCNVCNQSFSLNHNLQRHMRTHTGEKPHKCPVCTKEFAEGHNLKRHMISAHDGPTPYVCSICNRKFAENSILKKHTNKAHKSNASTSSTSSSDANNANSNSQNQ